MIITRITDTTAKIAPASGDASTSYEATVSEALLGSVRTISFAADADTVPQNGTLVPSAGRFTYAIVRMDGGDRNIEIFNGQKE